MPGLWGLLLAGRAPPAHPALPPLPLQERVAQFVVKEYGNAPAVPTAVLMELLRSELQVRAAGRVAFASLGGLLLRTLQRFAWFLLPAVMAACHRSAVPVSGAAAALASRSPSAPPPS